jgi:hypothetical protein
MDDIRAIRQFLWHRNDAQALLRRMTWKVSFGNFRSTARGHTLQAVAPVRVGYRFIIDSQNTDFSAAVSAYGIDRLCTD